jgi:hypothetical protein
MVDTAGRDSTEWRASMSYAESRQVAIGEIPPYHYRYWHVRWPWPLPTQGEADLVTLPVGDYRMALRHREEQAARIVELEKEVARLTITPTHATPFPPKAMR